MKPTDTIAAIATPPGKGGVGIIRVSGSLAVSIAKAILKKLPPVRYAAHSDFFAKDGSVIDNGLALYFKAPHSFTGEDVLELQGHGGPVVLDSVLKRTLELGARVARPGEFTERAFLNDKLDLVQAEAVADLIAAGSKQAAVAAMQTLQGTFSKTIDQFLQKLTQLRMLVEAAIDFPEEDIDFLSDKKIQQQLNDVIDQVNKVLASAKQGVILREGLTVVIAGLPNAGKSSLLNQLSGRESAIVTQIPGTTRDSLREYIQLDGIPLHIVDTAGLRESADIVEREGIKRTWLAMEKADCLLLVVDSSEQKTKNISDLLVQFKQKFPHLTPPPVITVHNKIDLTQQNPRLTEKKASIEVALSAKTGVGVELLTQALKKQMHIDGAFEGQTIARRRHIDAIQRALNHLKQGAKQLDKQQAGELLAEDLRQAQKALSEITGDFCSDDLLGKIFAEFCIGK